MFNKTLGKYRGWSMDDGGCADRKVNTTDGQGKIIHRVCQSTKDLSNSATLTKMSLVIMLLQIIAVCFVIN